MFKNLGLITVGFIGGFLSFAALWVSDVDNDGDVAYEDDKIKVTAGGNKSRNWAMAKVEYKQNKTETEEE